MANKRKTADFALSEELKAKGETFSYTLPAYLTDVAAATKKWGTEIVNAQFESGIVVSAASMLRRKLKGKKPSEVTEKDILALLDAWTPGAGKAKYSPAERLQKAFEKEGISKTIEECEAIYQAGKKAKAAKK